jgi:formylglycine-generating enzyme required for sulfatase activity
MDARIPESEGDMCVRGGSWGVTADSARSAARDYFSSGIAHGDVGFRCVVVNRLV